MMKIVKVKNGSIIILKTIPVRQHFYFRQKLLLNDFLFFF